MERDPPTSLTTRTVLRMDPPPERETWGQARARWFRTKSVEEFADDARKSGLSKTLSAFDLTILGLGAIIGAGIFALVGVAAGRAGPGVSLSFVIAGFACALAALCYAEFSSMVPVAGSAYTYTYASLGEIVAWMVGWNLVLEYAVGNIAVAVAWSAHLDEILHAFGSDIPHQFLHPPPEGVFNLPAMLIVLAVMFILLRGAKESARATLLFVGVKVFVLLAAITLGAFLVNPENFDPFLPFGAFGAVAGAALIFFAFIGFDAVSTAAEETKNPSRDVPIGILASLGICTALYLLVALVTIGLVGWEPIADHGAAVAHAFALRGEPWMSLVIAMGGIIGITSVLLVFQFGMPRIFFSMGRDGLLPERVTKVHSVTRVPYVTTIAGSVLVALFAGFTPIHSAAELTNIGTLFAFVIVCAGVIVLRYRAPLARRPFRIPGGIAVPVVGILVLGGLMLALPTVTWIRFVAWCGVGLMIYGFYGARAGRRRPAREFVVVDR
ncbi:MAG TPA: amino acid permease [Candidatus Thermoplasmatota archaeon]|nr:amino acid permease [Candidatus Thermoplasmatota archaeon]